MILSAKTLALVGIVWLSPSLAEAGDKDFYYEAQVRVDASGLVTPGDAARIESDRKKLLEAVNAMLRKHHLVLDGDEAEAAKVVVRLRWIDYENALLEIDIKVTRPDGSTAELETAQCTYLFVPELIAAVEERLNPLLGMLERPAPMKTVGVVGPKKAQPRTVAPKPKVRAWGPATLVGGGLAIGGVASIGVGAWLFGRESDSELAQDVRLDRSYSYKRPGIVSLAVGGVAFASGVALVVADLTVLKKRRASRRTAVLPTVDMAGAGLVWTGRF